MNDRLPSLAPRRPNRWAGLVFGLLGVIGFAAGAGMTLQRLIILHSWRETDARVIASRVETVGSQYRARLVVTFEAAGQSVESEPEHDYRGSKHGWIAEAVDRYPVGATTVVHRDPRIPARTRLEVGWNFSTFAFPLILLAAGTVFGGIGLLADRSAVLEATENTSRRARDARRLERAQYLGVAAFLGFISLGMLVSAVLLLQPAWERRGWPVITARVERSDIFVRSRVNLGKHHTSTNTYVGRLFLSYEVAGRSYESVAEAGTSSDREEIVRRLASLPPGTPWRVRHNPRNPHETAAVHGWPMVLPGVFLFAGLLVAGIVVLLVRSAPARLPK